MVLRINQNWKWWYSGIISIGLFTPSSICFQWLLILFKQGLEKMRGTNCIHRDIRMNIPLGRSFKFHLRMEMTKPIDTSHIRLIFRSDHSVLDGSSDDYQLFPLNGCNSFPNRCSMRTHYWHPLLQKNVSCFESSISQFCIAIRICLIWRTGCNFDIGDRNVFERFWQLMINRW